MKLGIPQPEVKLNDLGNLPSYMVRLSHLIAGHRGFFLFLLPWGYPTWLLQDLFTFPCLRICAFHITTFLDICALVHCGGAIFVAAEA